MKSELYELAKNLGTILKNKQLSLITTESCTGGLLASTITDIPGSSQYFDRGFVTYSNQAKMEVLGVDPQTIENFGAVSEETAQAMAEGSLKKNSTAQVSIAITGIAGPQGGSLDKPIGTVCFAFTILKNPTHTFTVNFSGDRSAIKTQTVQFALKKIVELL